MGGIDPVGEITARCHIIYRFGPRGRMPVKGDPSGLKLVPVSHPWRSLGGFLDYEHWLDRDRFVELDKAISLLHEDAEDTLIAHVESPEAIEWIRPVQPIDYQ